jgi:methionine-rich copper-binding protein CopC
MTQLRIGAAFQFLAICLTPAVAWAHAYLVKAVPAQRAVVFAPPERLQLWFNERLEAAFSTLTVTDAAGKAVDQGDMKVAPDDSKLLSVGLKPLTPGIYTVKFRVLSVDGHVVTNQFSFTVRGSR